MVGSKKTKVVFIWCPSGRQVKKRVRVLDEWTTCPECGLDLPLERPLALGFSGPVVKARGHRVENRR